MNRGLTSNFRRTMVIIPCQMILIYMHWCHPHIIHHTWHQELSYISSQNSPLQSRLIYSIPRLLHDQTNSDTILESYICNWQMHNRLVLPADNDFISLHIHADVEVSFDVVNRAHRIKPRCPLWSATTPISHLSLVSYYPFIQDGICLPAYGAISYS